MRCPATSRYRRNREFTPRWKQEGQAHKRAERLVCFFALAIDETLKLSRISGALNIDVKALREGRGIEMSAA